jgi:hypothetical protein
MRRAAAVLLVCTACSDGGPTDLPTPPLPGLVTVSGKAPWASGTCAGSSGQASGTLSIDAEVEPRVAVDPRDARHLVGIWQQDRWSNGGANGLVAAATFDGGHTWKTSFAKLTRCSGGAYQRASDPWVDIAPDGSVWQIAYAFDWTAPNRAMLVSRSPDGGLTWDAPIALQRDTDPDLAMDKETLTADPLDARFVYAVWDRLTGITNPANPQNTGPTWFARTADGGASWETARAIYDPGPNAQTISNQIVVLPDATLVNLLMVITQNNSANPRATVSVLRSPDRGLTWSTPVPIAEAGFFGVGDRKTGRGIRTGSVVPSIAVDRSTGTLFVAWEDARFSGARDGIALSTSTDGGLSWSPPVQVNGAPNFPAFTPSLAAAGGKLAVSYYDLRSDVPTDSNRTLVTHWLATSSDGGATFSETLIGAPFNIRGAPAVDGPAWFLGDYQAVAAVGPDFLPFFVAVSGNGPSDVYFRPADGAASPSTLTVAARGVQQLWRGARERWRFGTLFK